MSELIRTVNEADRMARLWREGKLCALELTERLAAEGFYAVRCDDRHCVAYLHGVRLELGGAYAPER